MLRAKGNFQVESHLAWVHRRFHGDPEAIVSIELLLEKMLVLESTEHHSGRKNEALRYKLEAALYSQEVLVVLKLSVAQASILSGI